MRLLPYISSDNSFQNLDLTELPMKSCVIMDTAIMLDFH